MSVSHCCLYIFFKILPVNGPTHHQKKLNYGETDRSIADLQQFHQNRLHVVHAPHRWYALDENEHGGVNQLLWQRIIQIVA